MFSICHLIFSWKNMSGENSEVLLVLGATPTYMGPRVISGRWSKLCHWSVGWSIGIGRLLFFSGKSIWLHLIFIVHFIKWVFDDRNKLPFPGEINKKKKFETESCFWNYEPKCQVFVYESLEFESYFSPVSGYSVISLFCFLMLSFQMVVLNLFMSIYIYIVLYLCSYTCTENLKILDLMTDD